MRHRLQVFAGLLWFDGGSGVYGGLGGILGGLMVFSLLLALRLVYGVGGWAVRDSDAIHSRRQTGLF